MPIIKKIFFVSTIVLLVTLLFWGVYYLSFRTPEAVTKPVENDSPATPNPPANIAPISTVTDEPVISPTFTPGGEKINYYARATGRVYEINPDGTNKKTISGTDLPGLAEVLWSPDKNKAVTKFPGTDGSFNFYLYDYAVSKSTPLKSNLDELAWQNDSNKIFYKYYDQKTKERTLNIADPDGTNWKKLADLAYRNVSISSVPKTGLVSFWPSADGMLETSFETIPVIGGDKKMVYKGAWGADFLWDNAGNNVLMSHTDKKGGNKLDLAIMNYNGGEFKNLGIPTLASKCAWSQNNKTVYFALPTGIPDNAIMPNDWKDKKFTTVDTFWKIDLASGEKKRIIDLEKIKDKYDATGLFLSPDESFLYFVNRVDGMLYRISL